VRAGGRVDEEGEGVAFPVEGMPNQRACIVYEPPRE
jgi:hypothetical protein